MTRHRRNQFDRPVAAGFSLVELMIAMTLLALVSVVGLQIMQLSETSFTQGRTQLNIQQKNQAISAFIKDDFKNETLGETSTPIIYRHKTAMPKGQQMMLQRSRQPRNRISFSRKCIHQFSPTNGWAWDSTEYENLMMPNCASQVWHLNRLIRFIFRFAVKKTSDEFHHNKRAVGQ